MARRVWVLLGLVPLLVAIALLVGASRLSAAQSDYMRRSLKGLGAIYVAVEDLDSVAAGGGLTGSQLRIDVELKLRRAGIKVLTREEFINATYSSYLYLHVNVIHPGDTPNFVHCVELSLRQPVILARDVDMKVITATTWSTGSLGFAGSLVFLDGVRGSVADKVDEFINDYLAANQ